VLRSRFFKGYFGLVPMTGGVWATCPLLNIGFAGSGGLGLFASLFSVADGECGPSLIGYLVELELCSTYYCPETLLKGLIRF